MSLSPPIKDEASYPSSVTRAPSAGFALKNGSLDYVAHQGGNGGETTYQEASGAPLEEQSPLGYRVNWLAIIFLNVNQMIGTGVFSTRKSS